MHPLPRRFPWLGGAVEEPVIRLIHPAICPIGGNTVLRIAGDHFCDQSVVRIGNKDAPVLSFDDTQGTERFSTLLIIIILITTVVLGHQGESLG